MDMLRVGWCEWVSLPGLAIPAIKAKLDTGARTSVLHAVRMETFRQHGRLKVRFWVRPLQWRGPVELCCVTDVLDQRMVSDSGGHRERRFVVTSPIRLGTLEWPIEITLTNRERMRFRMLLGRSAMRRGLLVDPSASCLTGAALARYYDEDKTGRKRERALP